MPTLLSECEHYFQHVNITFSMPTSFFSMRKLLQVCLHHSPVCQHYFQNVNITFSMWTLLSVCQHHFSVYQNYFKYAYIIFSSMRTLPSVCQHYLQFSNIAHRMLVVGGDQSTFMTVAISLDWRFLTLRRAERRHAYGIPAARSSLCFWRDANRLASSSCLSLAFRFAFLPCVFARRARASDNISSSVTNVKHKL